MLSLDVAPIMIFNTYLKTSHHGKAHTFGVIIFVRNMRPPHSSSIDFMVEIERCWVTAVSEETQTHKSAGRLIVPSNIKTTPILTYLRVAFSQIATIFDIKTQGFDVHS